MDPAALTTFYAQVPVFLLVLVRMGALFVTAPVLGGPYAPTTAKALLTVAVTLVVMPSVAHHAAPPPLDLSYLVLIARELMVGLTFGFVVNLAFHGVRAGGELINRHAGFSAAENFDPETDFGAGPMGDLMHMLVVLLFLATDLHLHLIASMARSFELIPLGGWTLTPGFARILDQGVLQMWTIAIALSFPVLTAVMLITVAEGVITRAVPQINVLHISFAIKILVSVLVLWATMPAAVAFLGTVLRLSQGLGEACLMVMR